MTRNGMLGPDYSTKFSPWLASGSLSPRFIYEEVYSYLLPYSTALICEDSDVNENLNCSGEEIRKDERIK